MIMMKPIQNLRPGLFMLILAMPLLAGCSIEQLLIGQWYTIDTPQAGSCPALEWRFVVGPQRSIDGLLSRDGQQKVADLAGTLAADDSFHITATDVAGRGTADVTGQFTSQISTITIQGNGAGGADCNGKSFRLRLGRYFSAAGGGGGGGGGSGR